MIRNRVCWALLILAAAGVFIYANSYYTLVILLAVIILPLISVGFMLAAAGSIELDMKVPEVMEKDGDTSFACSVRNRSLIPAARVMYRIIAESQLTYARREIPVRVSVAAHADRQDSFRLTDPRTGTTSIAAGRIRVEDAFGLFSKTIEDLPERLAVVYPAVRDIDVFLDRPVETLGDGRRWSPDRKGNDSSEIFEIREYRDGDDIKRIHWKLSEKTEEIMVREFSLPLNYSVFLLLEMTRADEEVMDRALEVYVSLSRILLEKGINHNLAWFDGTDEAFHVFELSNFGDMEVAVAELLTAFAYEDKTPALDYYLDSVYCDPRSTLIYVGTEIDESKVEEAMVHQQVRTVDARNEEEISELWI